MCLDPEIILRDRLVEGVDLLVERADFEPRVRRLGDELLGGIEIFARLGLVGHLDAERGARQMRVDVAGIELERLIEVGERRGRSA